MFAASNCPDHAAASMGTTSFITPVMTKSMPQTMRRLPASLFSLVRRVERSLVIMALGDPPCRLEGQRTGGRRPPRRAHLRPMKVHRIWPGAQENGLHSHTIVPVPACACYAPRPNCPGTESASEHSVTRGSSRGEPARQSGQSLGFHKTNSRCSRASMGIPESAKCATALSPRTRSEPMTTAEPPAAVNEATLARTDDPALMTSSTTAAR